MNRRHRWWFPLIVVFARDGSARGWQSRDGAFLTQSLETIRTLGEPFLPPRSPCRATVLSPTTITRPAADPGPGHDCLECDLLQCAAEVDGALENFIAGSKMRSRW